ncbi:hypothetical protein BFS06_12130 [Clostridium perfringens]|uniref:Uncharacterized protein n=1 Tax=Clostridium perfringens TaxID=1502 RepID=A0A140GQZ4_CLOPF|nr:hypothetical protein [Clostridium perfringens]AMN30953.1 hypothetical protein JFP838_pA0037 [Clostridium perfringens]TBX14949.1 hypothetical protein BFS06_12130 [Clostridium perfringens]
MKKIISKLTNNKGAISILAVGMIMIIVICITAYVDIAKRSWTLNELQADMDTAGINALQTSIDRKHLRAEILAIDNKNKIDTSTHEISLSDYSAKIQNEFAKDFSQLVKSNAKSVVKKWRILNQNVYFMNSKNGLGESNDTKPQIGLDTTMLVTLTSSNMFDNPVNYDKTFKNKMGGREFNITYHGKNKNGETELLIRSVTRIVYK